jgi:hypothetical protein
MNDLIQAIVDVTARRGFLRRIGGVMTLGLAGIMPSVLHAQTAPARSDGPDWPGMLKGRHRQVVDAYEVNSGFPLAFAYTFLAPNESATAVIVLRHGAFPIALSDAMWAIQDRRSVQDHRPGNEGARCEEPVLSPEARRSDRRRHGA